MQSNQNFPPKVILPPSNERLCDYVCIRPYVPPAVDVSEQNAKLFLPFHGVEFQPSEVCPKNFIIVDQTDYRSQIMYHPQVANRFNCHGPNISANYVEEIVESKDATNEDIEISSTLKEDSGDIDALLSLEEEDEEEYDEEEVSTARTNGSYGNSSPDSCCNYGSKPRRNRRSASITMSPSSSSSCSSERKQLKLKKMMKTLRGIVPDGNHMNTVAVLDEAVRYLKSLKVEVQKIGAENLKNHA